MERQRVRLVVHHVDEGHRDDVLRPLGPDGERPALGEADAPDEVVEREGRSAREELGVRALDLCPPLAGPARQLGVLEGRQLVLGEEQQRRLLARRREERGVAAPELKSGFFRAQQRGPAAGRHGKHRSQLDLPRQAAAQNALQGRKLPYCLAGGRKCWADCQERRNAEKEIAGRRLADVTGTDANAVNARGEASSTRTCRKL
mmetsp:Transcript_26328/g.62561  ORF Transcript_26328/g.62561 Transcript_26328/m.62561 type:complete len:203 (+) Transcript_26328:932-1540(+)